MFKRPPITDKKIIQRIRDSSPKVLSEFNTELVDLLSIGWPDDGPENICRRIFCQCGEGQLQLMGHSKKLGWLRAALTSMKESYEVPVSIYCPKCNSTQLLFDPRIHGWDGEFGESDGPLGDGDLSIFNTEGQSIYVCLAYEWVMDYESLNEKAKAIINIEDYFDDFAVAVELNGEVVQAFGSEPRYGKTYGQICRG